MMGLIWALGFSGPKERRVVFGEQRKRARIVVREIKESAKMGDTEKQEFVYRISTAPEWELWQKSGSLSGEQLDKSSGFIHLSNLNQVESTLNNFFLNIEDELYLVQLHADKLGEGLVYEVVDGTNSFPHFYGPSRSFSPIPLDVVSKAEKITLSDGRFSCALLD